MSTGVSSAKQPSTLKIMAAHWGQGRESFCSIACDAATSGSHAWLASACAALGSPQSLHTHASQVPHFHAELRKPRQPSTGHARTKARRSRASFCWPCAGRVT